MDYQPLVMESQLDWLTLAVHSREKTDRLRSHALRWAKKEEADGNSTGPFRLNGYTGWRAGRVRYGERENAGLVQLSGDFAEQAFDLLYPLRDNISRVDLAVTVDCQRPQDQHASEQYQAALAAYAEHPQRSLPSLVQDAAGGSTLYLGHRTSNLFFRCYNKGAEAMSKGTAEEALRYAHCWRYEIECKGERALAYSKAVYETDSRSDYIRDTVHRLFTDHGVTPLYDAGSSYYLVPGFRRRSDNDRRLAWFRRAVQPAVKKLIESGHFAEALDALGIDGIEPPF